MRNILLGTPETLQLATEVPKSVTGALPRFEVNLQDDVSDLNANHRVRCWKNLLHLATDLDGECSDPPFSGWIGVEARERGVPTE